MIPQNPRGIPVNIQNLENQLTILTAELSNQQDELEAFLERGKTERNLWAVLWTQLVPAEVPRSALNNFIGASKAYDDSLERKRQIELSKLKAQVAIAQAMLNEAKGLESDQAKVKLS